MRAAIAAAPAGAVICLSSGDYGTITIGDVNKSNDVVVQAASGASPSVELEVHRSHHLRFVGLTIRRLRTANVRDITFSHNTFTGASLVETQNTDANILFDANRFDGINIGADDYEGRLTVRGYDNTAPVGVTISNNHFGGGGCSDGVQVVGNAYGVQIGPGNEFRRSTSRAAARLTSTRSSSTVPFARS